MTFIIGIIVLIVISCLFFNKLWNAINNISIKNSTLDFIVKNLLRLLAITTVGVLSAVGFIFVFVFLYKTPNNN